MVCHIRTWVSRWAISCLSILTLLALGCSPDESGPDLPEETTRQNTGASALPEETIYQAAVSGNLERVKELVDSGVDPALPGWYALETPLHLAARAGNIDIVRYLVEHGVPVDPENRKGETPLVLAAWNGHEQVVRYLHEKGAGYPILEAARIGDVDRVRELLEADPDLLAASHEYWGTPLHIAAREGHTDLVEYLLSIGADMNDPVKTLGTPFEIAGEWGHVETVKVFLEHGARPTAGDFALIGDFDGMVRQLADEWELPEDERGENPLVMACKSGETEIAQYLLQRGTDPMSRRFSGGGALDRAIHHEHADLIRLLMRYPGQVEALTRSGYSPMTYAASRGRTSAIETLVELGEDVNAPDRAGRTPLEAAVRQGFTETVRVLLNEGAHVRLLGKNLLAYAGDPKCRAAAELLAARGAEVTPAVLGSWLAGAMSRGASGEVANLQEAGADANAPGPYGRTPLHAAARGADPSLVETLLNTGAVVDATDPLGGTPLHSAAAAGAAKVAEVLLEHGAQVNARDKKGLTPLYLACLWDHAECVDILLEHGADPSIAGPYGVSPLIEAVRSTNPEILRSLLAAGIPADATLGDSTILQRAVAGGRPEMARILLAHGADPSVKNDDGMTLLHLAALHQWPEDRDLAGIVKELVSLGLDIDARDEDGCTPLFVACRWDRPDCVDVLLEHGADPTIADSHGRSPIVLSLWCRTPHILRSLLAAGIPPDATHGDSTILQRAVAGLRPEMVRVLLDHGADATVRTNDGMTLLHLAARHPWPEDADLDGIVKKILSRGVDIEAQDNDGRTAVAVAVSFGNRKCVQVLLDNGATMIPQKKSYTKPLPPPGPSGYEGGLTEEIIDIHPAPQAER